MLHRLYIILVIIALSISYTHAQKSVESGKSEFAKFSYTVEECAQGYVVSFKDRSIGEVISVLWDFGDGNTSTERSPIHIYKSPGLYNVSLSIVVKSSSITFKDKEVKKISITEKGWSHIGGTVFAGSFPTDIGYACLYQFEEDNVFPVDTAYFDTLGFYFFYQKENTEYLIKIDIPSCSENASAYLPTYYGNSIMWNNAESIALSETCLEYDINLAEAGENSPGIGLINGHISYSNELNFGQEAKNIPVILIHKGDSAMICKYSNDNGKFEFNEIELGEYEVYAEVTGKNTIPHFTFLSENKPNIESLGIIITNDEVITFVNEDKNELTINQIDLYPNPCRGNLTMKFEEDKETTYTLNIINAMGQLVICQKVLVQQGLSKVQFNFSHLSKGTYFIRLRSAEGKIAQQKLTLF